MAVAVLAKLGYRVVASTGRPEEEGYLRRLGAAELIERSELGEPNPRPLQAERWAGAVDAVGSQTLANVLATTRYGGVVTACGLAQGNDLPTTVLPFILRGVSLVGVDSVNAPHCRPRRGVDPARDRPRTRAARGDDHHDRPGRRGRHVRRHPRGQGARSGRRRRRRLTGTVTAGPPRHVVLAAVQSIDGYLTRHDEPGAADLRLRGRPGALPGADARGRLALFGGATYRTDRAHIRPDLRPDLLRVVWTRAPAAFAGEEVPGQLEFSAAEPAELLADLGDAGLGGAAPWSAARG